MENKKIKIMNNEICYQIKIFNINTDQVYKTVFAKKMEDIIDKYITGLHVAYVTICAWKIKNKV